MLTTVRRDILDHSISGNKIFGGSINWIDSLVTDYIEIPHDSAHPENGGGLVDGNGVLFGSRVPIGILESLSVKARTEFGLRDSAFTGYSIYAARVSGGAYLRVKNSTGSTRIYLGTGTAQKSYFLDKLIVGKSTNDNPSSAFEALTGFIDTLVFGSLVGPTGTINSLFTKDPLDTTVSLTSIIGLVYDLNSFVLEEPFITLSGMSASQASQLLSIIESPSITSDNWSHIPSLDQDLGSGDETTFETVSIGSLNVGETSNKIENYKEWIGVARILRFVNHPTITQNAIVDIVKCGKLVTINVRPDSGAMLKLHNASAGAISGTLEIQLNETIFNPIKLNLYGSPFIITEFYADVNGTSVDTEDGTTIQCLIAPPQVAGGFDRIYIGPVGTGSSLFFVNAGAYLKIRSFSISYIVI